MITRTPLGFIARQSKYWGFNDVTNFAQSLWKYTEMGIFALHLLVTITAVFELRQNLAVLTGMSKIMADEIKDKAKMPIIKLNNGTLSVDDRMRILANLMIDKILQDYENNTLKFVPKKVIIKSVP